MVLRFPSVIFLTKRLWCIKPRRPRGTVADPAGPEHRLLYESAVLHTRPAGLLHVPQRACSVLSRAGFSQNQAPESPHPAIAPRLAAKPWGACGALCMALVGCKGDWPSLEPAGPGQAGHPVPQLLPWSPFLVCTQPVWDVCAGPPGPAG